MISTRAVEQSVTGRPPRRGYRADRTAPGLGLLRAPAGRSRAGRTVRDRPGSASRSGSRLDPGLPRATPRRCSKAGTATGTARTELAEEGKTRLAPFAPWWNHLARRLIAAAALQDGWGQPVDLAARGHQPTSRRPGTAAWRRRAGACCARQAPGYRVLAGARPRYPPRCAGSASPAGRWTCTCWSRSGFSNTEIAERLFISPKTVETHVASLISKTGQGGRRELVAHAARSAPAVNRKVAGQSKLLNSGARRR